MDPDELIAFLRGVVNDRNLRMSDRLAAAQQLLDRGWGRPIATSEVSVETAATSELPPDWDQLPAERREAWLAGIGLAS
ncbi:MAG: hypothetical protein KIT31_18620 [Deltaproteobacteria bacterium]|nr:hypothetical protein [Deltaproteobacteria bacterium]